MEKYSDIILKIQEYADKTLQFGCIVDTPTRWYWIIVQKTNPRKWTKDQPHYVCKPPLVDGNTNGDFFVDEDKITYIIGLPMDMNRVNYLYLFYQNFYKDLPENDKLTMQYNYYHIDKALQKNPNLYNLNVFDWHEEFVKLVYDMLRPLPVIKPQ